MIDLKLKDLRYLVAVAEERHFGRAAAKCFVSQPTLSAQLRKLEEALGVQLVERRPRQVTLTEAGVEIAERARSMLESGEEIVSLAQARRDPLAGSLRVGLLPTIGPYLLPLVALKLRRALPRLELLLYEYQTVPLLERLRAGELDVGILALPVQAENFAVRELYREPFVLAMPETHALRRARACISRICRARRCCCWRTDIVCAIRHSRSAVAAVATRSMTFAPPASRRCARWWPPVPA